MADHKNGFEFQVQLTAKDLWQFSLYHANKGFMGIFNVIFSIAAVVALIIRWDSFTVPYRVLLLICAMMFTVWQPLILYSKARRQAKVSAVKEQMSLTFRADGLCIAQAGQSSELKWDQIGRVDRTPTMLVFYMDRIHAYLLPKRVMQAQEGAFCELLREHLPKERRKRV